MSVATFPDPLTEEAGETMVAVAPPSEDGLYEIVNGQRVEKIVSFNSSWVATRLSHRLGPFTETAGLGTVVSEAIFTLDSSQRLQRRPDLAFLTVARLPLYSWDLEGDLDIVPNLAVEVVSPHDLFRSVMAKVREYFDHGVERVWAILPEERCVYVFTSPNEIRKLGDDQELADETLFPGWRMPVSELFKPKT